jgi:hypothetical protein
MSNVMKWGVWVGLIGLAFGVAAAVGVGTDASLTLRRIIFTEVALSCALLLFVGTMAFIQMLSDIESER